MNFMTIKRFDMNNGDGNRVSVFVSGCPHKCNGCFNEESWKYTAGEPFTEHQLDSLMLHLKQPTIQGLSILGGEPLAPRNLLGVLSICKRMREDHPDKDIWLWTGYTMEELRERKDWGIINRIFFYLNTLVDGRFEKDLMNPDLKYRGSSNQRVFKKIDGKFNDITSTLTVKPASELKISFI